MHPALNRFSSDTFYGGRVVTDEAVREARVALRQPRGVPWPNATAPLAFVPVRSQSSGGNELREAERGWVYGERLWGAAEGEGWLPKKVPLTS